MDNAIPYQKRVEQRLRESGYVVDLAVGAMGITLDVVGYKPLQSRFDPRDVSYVFMLTRPMPRQDIFVAAEALLKWSGSLPIPRSASGIKQRVSVTVFIAERFLDRQKAQVCEYEPKHNRKWNFPVLVETRANQVTFNRSHAWNSVVGRKWGQWVLPKIVRTIDDMLAA